MYARILLITINYGGSVGDSHVDRIQSGSVAQKAATNLLKVLGEEKISAAFAKKTADIGDIGSATKLLGILTGVAKGDITVGDNSISDSLTLVIKSAAQDIEKGQADPLLEAIKKVYAAGIATNGNKLDSKQRAVEKG